MNISKRLSGLLMAGLLVIGLGACGGGGGQEIAEITIRPVGDTMEYETEEFTVAPGQQVRIIFENTATNAAMQHNVVVLNEPSAIDRVGMAAMTAAATDYIPEDQAIIANTPMSGPGETVEVTFTAPEQPGNYPYICTFPGHYITMRGQMIVE